MVTFADNGSLCQLLKVIFLGSNSNIYLSKLLVVFLYILMICMYIFPPRAG